MTCARRLAVVVVVLLAGRLAAAGPIADLLALHLDEGEGTWAYDASANNNDTTLVGGATWSAGNVGNAVELDGVNHYLNGGTAPSFQLTSAVTVEAWIYPDDVAGTQTIISRGRDWWTGYQVLLSGNQLRGVIQGQGGGAVVPAPGVVTPNQWHHALLTYESGAGGAVYLDGASTPIPDLGDIKWVSTDPANPGDHSNWPLLIGQHNWNLYRFDGKVDEVAVYGRSLSSTEVGERYNGGAGIPVEPAVAPPAADILALHFDEAEGPAAADATAGLHHGFLRSGAAHTLSGKSDGAIHLDGVNDHVRVALSAGDSPTSGLTVEGWFLVDQNPDVDGNNNWRWVFNKGGWGSPFDCILEQNRQLCFSLKLDGDPTHYRWWTGQYLPLGEWAHAAWTYDAATGMMKVYVNGVQASRSIGAIGDLATSNLDLFLSWPSVAAPNGNGAFPGLIDEFAVYSRALSGAEVFARYKDGPPAPALALPPNPPADVLLLHCNEGTGTTARDETFPRNDGTLLNGASWGAGAYGAAVHFDGVDDHVRVPLPASQSPTGALTIEGWFLVDQNPDVDGQNNWRWLFNKGGWASPFDCILEQSRQLAFSLTLDGDPTHYRWWTGQYLPLGEWAHAAWTYDAATGMMRCYVNGIEASHYIGAMGDLATNDLDLFLSWPSGTATPNGWGAFPGLMDEFAIYSRVLSRDEILVRIAHGPPIYPEPGTLALLLGGLAALVSRRRRRL